MDDLHTKTAHSAGKIRRNMNQQTNERWSSSGIVNRAQGAAMSYPVTRPGDLRAGISR